MAEYESMVLGLNALKIMKVKKIPLYGYVQLVIDQVKGVYEAKHPKIRSYKNLVLELLEYFDE